MVNGKGNSCMQDGGTVIDWHYTNMHTMYRVNPMWGPALKVKKITGPQCSTPTVLVSTLIPCFASWIHLLPTGPVIIMIISVQDLVMMSYTKWVGWLLCHPCPYWFSCELIILLQQKSIVTCPVIWLMQKWKYTYLYHICYFQAGRGWHIGNSKAARKIRHWTGETGPTLQPKGCQNVLITMQAL